MIGDRGTIPSRRSTDASDAAGGRATRPGRERNPGTSPRELRERPCPFPSFPQDPAARRYESLTFGEAVEKQLGVMDLTALTMCMEHKLPLIVFDYKVPGNITRAVRGEPIGTLVKA